VFTYVMKGQGRTDRWNGQIARHFIVITRETLLTLANDDLEDVRAASVTANPEWNVVLAEF